MAEELTTTLADPEVKKSPYHAHDLIRAEAPVYRDPMTGMYVITRYDNVRRLALDTKNLSNATGLIRSLEGSSDVEVNRLYAERGCLPISTLVTADPPEHRLYRRLVEKAFTAKRVEGMHDYMLALVGELIDAFIERGEVEFVEQFAVRLPVMVIADQLGIPRHDLPLFKKWSDAAIEQIDPLLTLDREIELTRFIIDMQRYFIERAETLREQPQDNLFSDLVHAEVDGRRLDNRELCSIVQQLLVAGNETTTSALASMMVLMIHQPRQADLLHDRPDSAPAFVEELLRLRSPVQGMLRRALADIDVDGMIIPKGSIVHLLNAAANHDGSVFICPHDIDLARPNGTKHMAFGMGIHHCIGSQLARAELLLATQEITRRMHNFRYADGEKSVDYMTGHTYGPLRVHVRFDPR